MKTLTVLFIIGTFSLSWSQNVGINGTGATPNASAGLDIDFTNRGILIPRVALTATNAAGPITAPATSLMVYNTATAGAGTTAVSPGYYYWNGTAWVRVSLDGADWRITGNAGTVAATNFIGTTDAIDFVVRTNNIERMRTTATGNVGIGTAAPSNRLTVVGGDELLIDAAGTGGWLKGFDDHHSIYMREGATDRINYYEFGNTVAAGGGHRFFTGGVKTAQTLKFQVANDGNVSYIPFGVGPATNLFGAMDVNLNGTGNYAYFRQNVLGGNPNAGFNQGLAIGWNRTNGQGETNLIFSNGLGSATGLEIGDWNGTVYTGRMKVLGGSGNVGIGTLTPAYRLDVNNTVRIQDFGGPGSQNLIVGDDVYFGDMDVLHRLGLISLINANIGELQLGSSATNPILSGNPGYLAVSQEMRVQVDANRFRRATSPNMWLTDLFDGGQGGVYAGNHESEEGGFWANGNYAMIISPGDNDLVKFVDEDFFDNAGTAFDNNAMRARIDGAGQYFQISDRNLKVNIVKIDNGLQKITALNGYTYDFVTTSEEKAKGYVSPHAAGVIAQEVEKVIPEAVSHTDGQYMVNYNAFVPVFIEAIKEQQAQIEALNKKIEALEKELQDNK